MESDARDQSGEASDRPDGAAAGERTPADVASRFASGDLVVGGALVLPQLRKRRRKYKAKDVEQALRALAAQINDFERVQTEKILGSLATMITVAQNEAERVRAEADGFAADAQARVNAALSQSRTEASRIVAAAESQAAEIVAGAHEELGRLHEQIERIRTMATRMMNIETGPPDELQ